MNVYEFPIEIRHLMLYRQQKQNGKRNWSEFQSHKISGFEWDIISGFEWDKTPEKEDFWWNVIGKEEFNVFYAKYPKVDYHKGMPEEIIMLALDRRVEQGWPKYSLRTFGFDWDVTPERWIFWNEIEKENYSVYYEKYGHPTKTNTSTPSYGGQIIDFPSEVVELMLQRQFEQTRKRDVSVFENNVEAGESSGGFDWDATPEKYNFWGDVIRKKKFEVFFKKYPKSSLIHSHIKTKQNDKESTTSGTGIKVFKPVATITNGEKRTGTRISGRSSKTTIGSGHISYQAIIGY